VADYGTIGLEYNTSTSDASPVWGTALSLSGVSGANELRMASTGAGAGGTASASWPFIGKPASGVQTVGELWAFTADTTGSKIGTYTGDNTKALVMRWSFDNAGNPVSAMQWSCFGDNTHAAPSPGTQPPTTHNDAFTNGHSSDTSSTSYIKINAFGSGLTAAGSQETPSAGSIGTNPSATTGTAGSVATTAGDWLNAHGAWQSAQGFVQYILGGAIPKTATAFKWYISWVIFVGANISTGTWVFVLTLQYSFS